MTTVADLRAVDPVAYDTGWLAGYLLLPAAHPDVVWLAGWREGARFTRCRPVLQDDEVRARITRALAAHGMLTDIG